MNLIKLQRSPLNAWSGLNLRSNFQEELERLFNFPLGGATLADGATVPWVPALEVYEEKDGYVVTVELPGVNKEDVKLSLEQGTLTIAGERKNETKAETATVYHSERFYGRFQRTVNLPETVATSQVKAAYKDGVLTVTLPKSEEAKPKQINITLN
jgi:HSP20 family protein